jgi:type I restriction enzyme S subunit
VGNVLLVTRTGVGKVAITETDICISQDFTGLIPDKAKVDSRFLFYYLKSRQEHLVAQQRGATIQGITREVIARLEFPLFPLDEQKRIAAILSKADRLRRLRRYARELSDGYLQSVFNHTFGDPSSNPKGWGPVSVEKILARGRGGIRTGPFGSSLKRNEYVEQGIPVWGIDNIKESEFVEEGSLFIKPAKYRELSRYTVENGDILISRAGTVGRMCVAYPTQHPSIIGTNLLRVAVDTSAIIPEYFTALFTYFASRVESMSSGGTAYSFINPRTLKALEIPLPPLLLQQKFAHIVQEFEQLRAQQREAERQAEHLFQSLLHLAFGQDF